MSILSPHRQLTLHMKELSWELNKWHPRPMYDHNEPPPISNPLSGEDVSVVDKQWFTAVLPCEEGGVQQFVYAHMDYRPQGMWIVDITDADHIQRMYPTTMTMIYHSMDITIKNPKFLIIHMFRDVSESTYPMPTRCTCGHIDPVKFDQIMRSETRKISTDWTSMLDAIHDKVVNNSGF